MEQLAKTKLKMLVFALLVGAATPASAQIYYSYDAAGNRTSKTITLTKTMKNMARPDTVIVAESEPFIYDMDELQNDVLGKAEIKIYPNPTQGVLRVDISGVELSTTDQIEIFNGKVHLVKSVSNITGSNMIDLSESVSGIYFMRITIGDEQTTWRIIKE